MEYIGEIKKRLSFGFNKLYFEKISLEKDQEKEYYCRNYVRVGC